LVEINQRCFYAPHLKVITAESLGVVQMHASESCSPHNCQCDTKPHDDCDSEQCAHTY
jgi:hypothetical protein